MPQLFVSLVLVVGKYGGLISGYIQTSELSGHIRVFSDQTEKLFRELDIPDKQSLRIYQLCTSIALCLIDTDTICKHSLPMLGAPASNLPVSRGMRGWR